MAVTSFNVSIDEELKRQFETLCSSYDMNTETAFKNLIKEAVESKKIPTNEQKTTLEEGQKAFYQLREIAKANGLQDMTLEEINAEIAAVRAGK